MFLIPLISLAVQIFIWIIIIDIALYWLSAFNIINLKNPQAQNLVHLIKKMTNPVFIPLRKYIPPIGGLDLTPIVAIIGITVIEQILIRIILAIFS